MDKIVKRGHQNSMSCQLLQQLKGNCTLFTELPRFVKFLFFFCYYFLWITRIFIQSDAKRLPQRMRNFKVQTPICMKTAYLLHGRVIVNTEKFPVICFSTNTLNLCFTQSGEALKSILCGYILNIFKSPYSVSYVTVICS